MSVAETANSNETLYTPGPWRLEPNGTSPREDGYNVIGPHGTFLAHLPVIEETIRQGNDYQTLHHGEEIEARARLIVAAPLILSALKQLRNEITGVLGIATTLRDDIGNTNISVLLRKIDAAETAIAAAEGS